MTKRLWLRLLKVLALLIVVAILLIAGIEPEMLLMAIKLFTGI